MTHVPITSKLFFGLFNPQYLLNQIIIHILMLAKPKFVDLDIVDDSFDD
jgi:hypothetical protein